MISEQRYLEMRTDQQDVILVLVAETLALAKARNGIIHIYEIELIEKAITEFDEWDQTVEWD